MRHDNPDKPIIAAVSVMFLIGLFLRIFAVSTALKDERYNPYSRLMGDAARYVALAVGINQGVGYSDCYEPVLADVFKDPKHVKPAAVKLTARKAIGYPLFLAAIFSLFGYSLTPVLFAQAVISALSALIVYLIALRVYSWRSAMVAYLLTLFYYPFWHRAATIMVETLLIFFTLLFFYCLVRWRMRPSVSAAFLTALSAGASILVKPVFLPVIPLYLLWAFAGARRQHRLKPFTIEVVTFALGLAIFIAPWVVRNYQHSKRIILTPTFAGYQLIQVYNPYNLDFQVYESDPGFITEDYPGFQDYIEKDLKLDGWAATSPILAEYLQDRAYARASVKFIFDNPVYFFRAIFRTFWNTWRADYPDKRVLNKANGIVSGAGGIPFLFFKAENLVFYVGMIPFFIFGVYISIKNRNTQALSIILFFAYFVIVHSVFASMIRYRIIVMPLFFILSAFGLIEFWNRVKSLSK